MSKLDQLKTAQAALNNLVQQQPEIFSFLKAAIQFLTQRINFQTRVDKFNTQDNDTSRTNP